MSRSPRAAQSTDTLLRLDFHGAQITRRASDDYLNLSELVKAANAAEVLAAEAQGRKPVKKLLADWLRVEDTLLFLDALADDTGIAPGLVTPKTLAAQGYMEKPSQPARTLVEVRGRGTQTWGHPDVAVELAGWLSKPLRVAINRWFRHEVERQRHAATRPADVLQPAFGFAEQILEALENRCEGNKGISAMAAASGLAFHHAHNAGNVQLTGHPAKHWREVSGYDNWQQHADWPWQKVKGLASLGSVSMVEQLAPDRRNPGAVRQCIEFSHAKAREFAEAVGLSPQPRFLPRRLTERRVRALLQPATEGREQLALLA